ncbi:MAG: hypothetical protein AAGC46_08690 [Solirubrobacteraceae bacterium]
MRNAPQTAAPPRRFEAKTGPSTPHAPQTNWIVPPARIALHSHRRARNSAQPSTSWANIDGSGSSVSRGRRATRIPDSATALHANVSASAARPQAGLAAATIRPPITGPIISPAEIAIARTPAAAR